MELRDNAARLGFQLRLVNSAENSPSPTPDSPPVESDPLQSRTPIAMFAELTPIIPTRATRATRIPLAAKESEECDSVPTEISDFVIRQLERKLLSNRDPCTSLTVTVETSEGETQLTLAPNENTREFARRALVAARGDPDAITIETQNCDKDYYAGVLCDTFPGLYASLAELQRDIAVRIGIENTAVIPPEAYLAWLSLLPDTTQLCSLNEPARGRILSLATELSNRIEHSEVRNEALNYLDSAWKEGLLPALTHSPLTEWRRKVSEKIFGELSGTLVAAITDESHLLRVARLPQRGPDRKVSFLLLCTYLDAVRYQTSEAIMNNVLQPLLRTTIPDLSGTQLAEVGMKIIDAIIEHQALISRSQKPTR